MHAAHHQQQQQQHPRQLPHQQVVATSPSGHRQAATRASLRSVLDHSLGVGVVPAEQQQQQPQRTGAGVAAALSAVGASSAADQLQSVGADADQLQQYGISKVRRCRAHWLLMH